MDDGTLDGKVTTTVATNPGISTKHQIMELSCEQQTEKRKSTAEARLKSSSKILMKDKRSNLIHVWCDSRRRGRAQAKIQFEDSDEGENKKSGSVEGLYVSYEGYWVQHFLISSSCCMLFHLHQLFLKQLASNDPSCHLVSSDLQCYYIHQ